MLPESPPALSWTEKLDLVPAFLSIGELLTIYNLLTMNPVDKDPGWAASRALVEWPLRPGSRADTYYHHLVHAVVRQVRVRIALLLTFSNN